MSCRVAVLGDLHFGEAAVLSGRRSEIADILLLRVVQRLNRLVHPDVVLLLGDVLDAGDAPDAPERRAALRSALDQLACPVLVIPGNHDGDEAAFYRDFERPPDIVDVAGVRFLPFLDRQEPGYHATRAAADLDRFRAARAGYDGPIVALQHVPILPVDATACPYNYLNAPAVLDAMRAAGVTASVSGHYHAGLDSFPAAGTTFLSTPALCEQPFRFQVVALDGDRVAAESCALAMPAELGLIDRHVHTQFAYCSENMDAASAIGLARDFGLAGLNFAEHSGQLYFARERYWAGDCQRLGLAGAVESENRMPAYHTLAAEHRAPGTRFGLELDADLEGRPVVTTRDRAEADFVIGSIHRLRSLQGDDDPSPDGVMDEYLGLMERFLTHDVRVLTHPFRIFRRTGLPEPARLFEPTVRLLKQTGTAAELNFHTNEPPEPFVRMCLDAGVKLTFGSDAHNLYEIGDFALHLDLLQRAGFSGDLRDVLL